MKKVLAGVMALAMVLSAAPLPDNYAGVGGSVVAVSAETLSGKQVYSSNLNLNGRTLEINGDMYVTAGEINIGTGNLIVHGGLYFEGEDHSTSSTGCLIMKNGGSVTVDGDLVYRITKGATNSYNGKEPNTAGLINSGTITVGGGVYDHAPLGNNNTFQTSGSSVLKMTMTGKAPYTIQGDAGTKIAKLYTSSTASKRITLSGAAHINSLETDLYANTDGTFKIMTLSVNNKKTVDIVGNIDQQSGGVALNGGTMKVTGNFQATSGITSLGGGNLTVTGDYKLYNKTLSPGSSAGLQMTNANDRMTVGGNFWVYNTSSSANSTTLSNGILYVGGDFICGTASGQKAKISFADPHKTYLNGSKYQDVVLPDGVKFNDLYLTQNPSQYPGNITSKAKNYHWESQQTPTPAKKNLSDCAITFNSGYDLTYSGSAKTPPITVTYGGTTLQKDTDYTVSYTNNTNAGSGATVTISAASGGNYEGSKTQTFTISKKDLSLCTISVNAYDKSYSGKAKTPGVTIKNGSVPLTGSDYTISSYSNNTDAGTATIKVSAGSSGNYTGSTSTTFPIDKLDITGAAVTLEYTSTVSDGSEKRPAVKSVVKNGVTVGSGDYTVSYSGNKTAGTAIVTVTANSGSKNFTGKATANFTITTPAATAVDASNFKVTLDKTTVPLGDKPKVTVYDNSNRVLTEGTDYTLSFINDNKIGTASVTVNYTGTKYKGSSGKKNYTVRVRNGDVDLNGKVDITDVTLTISHVRGKGNLTADQLIAANVAGGSSSKVDITDVTTLISHVRGVKRIDP